MSRQDRLVIKGNTARDQADAIIRQARQRALDKHAAEQPGPDNEATYPNGNTYWEEVADQAHAEMLDEGDTDD